MAANHKNSKLRERLKLLFKIKEKEGDKDILYQFTRPVYPRDGSKRSVRKVRKRCNISGNIATTSTW